METYSTSDHLFADLGIPSGSTGRLPLGQRTRAGLDAEPEEKLDRKSPRKRSARSAAVPPAAAEQSRPEACETGEEAGRRRPRRTRRRSRSGVPAEA